MIQFSSNLTNANESRALHDIITSHGYITDVIPQNADYKDYSVLVMPYAPFIAKQRQKELLDFVKAGGILILEGPCGIYD
jgi:beta-galactosidase GanA